MKRLLVFVLLVFAVDLAARQDLVTARSAELRDAEVRWQARQPRTYQFTVEVICFCFDLSKTPPRFEVTDGVSRSMQELEARSQKAYARYATVEAIYAAIRRSLSSGAYKSSVRYDVELGYPVVANLDPQQWVADDELIIRVTDFKVVTPKVPAQGLLYRELRPPAQP